MRKRRIGAVVVAAVALSMLLWGCKEKAPEDTQGQTQEAAQKAEEEESEPEGKDPDRTIKVGFVFSNIISTDAWAQTSENARLYLEENCENIQTFKVENIAGGADCERVMREYINDGCEMIVGTSFDYMDYMLALADEFPDIAFINGSGYETKDNLSIYIAKLEQRCCTGGLIF